jgi:integrase
VPSAAAVGTLFVVIGRPPAGTTGTRPGLVFPLPSRRHNIQEAAAPRRPRHSGRRYSTIWTLPGGSSWPTNPLFTATTDAGQYLRDYYGAHEPAGHEPLTSEAVAQAQKRYAAEAGVDPDSATIHSLRHLGAELYYAASGDVHETQRFLDHARLETTSIYLQQLTGEDHRHWQAMANELGV